MEVGQEVKPDHIKEVIHTIANLTPQQLRPFSQQKNDLIFHRIRRYQNKVREDQPHVLRIGLIQPQISLLLVEQTRFSAGGQLQTGVQKQHH